jgi:excisionase family DNA binding protein
MCIERWQTAREAAERLGLHHGQICQLAREGRLRAWKWGGQWHIERGAQVQEGPGEEPAGLAESWPYLSVEEAAAALGISPTAVRERVKAGQLGAQGTGRPFWKAWHIPRSAILLDTRRGIDLDVH